MINRVIRDNAGNSDTADYNPEARCENASAADDVHGKAHTHAQQQRGYNAERIRKNLGRAFGLLVELF